MVKKNNKGFTLIEILSVIIILGILLMISGVSVSKYIKNSQNKTYLSFEKNLKTAANNYMIDCIESNEEDCTIPEYGGSITLTYNELVNKGYSKIIKDPQSNGYCDESYVIVKNQNSSGVKLDYEVCLLCDKYKTDGGCTSNASETYTVKYNANGGTGEMAATICNVGEGCKISNNEFEVAGKYFIEWNTKRDGTGQGYGDGDNVQNITSAGKRIVLYAIWEKYNINEEFFYNGRVQEYTIITDGDYQLEVYGAEGGYRNNRTYASKGGYAIGTVFLEKGTKLYIYVGGNGTNHKGYNGGGNAGYTSIYGGGGTDIRVGTDDLYARLIVAGGGGSVGAPDKKGGDGGGTTGGAATEGRYLSGACSNVACGRGGTQTSGGAGVTNKNNIGYIDTPGKFGTGGKGYSNKYGYGGAGGGGWYGGSGSMPDSVSGDDDRGGGGGSGFIYTPSATVPSEYLLNVKYYLKDASMSVGITSPDSDGDGYVRIRLINN